jgi:hypothetical protein
LIEIERMRPEILGGDGFAMLAAIYKCANRDLVMPEWLAREFIRRYYLVLSCRADSWDDAFGRPYPKNARLHALRKQRELKPAVWLEVQAILHREPETAIDAQLFERVGAKLHLGKTLTEKYYRNAIKLMGPAKRLRG